MRALLIGLVGALVVAGGAEAKKNPHPENIRLCALTDRGFTFDRAVIGQDRPAAHADLVGRRARIVRAAAGGTWDAIEIAVGEQHFVLRYDVTPHATPAVMASSWSGSQGQGIDWRGKSSSSIATEADIVDGPLAGLTLGSGSCD